MTEDSLDFKKFNLGNGSVREKQAQLNMVVHNLLNDDK